MEEVIILFRVCPSFGDDGAQDLDHSRFGPVSAPKLGQRPVGWEEWVQGCAQVRVQGPELGPHVFLEVGAHEGISGHILNDMPNLVNQFNLALIGHSVQPRLNAFLHDSEVVGHLLTAKGEVDDRPLGLVLLGGAEEGEVTEDGPDEGVGLGHVERCVGLGEEGAMVFWSNDNGHILGEEAIGEHTAVFSVTTPHKSGHVPVEGQRVAHAG
ncbi:MAG: hypothetical protein Q9O62_01580 [Ardenticatenia bacterium]|nr:hypothetical protein [Ardenticatenia bacterium]